MTRVYLIRHAEAAGNAEPRFHGHYDSELTEKGRLQLKRLRGRFEGVVLDAIYSSDLKRAYETAKAVAGDRDIEVIRAPELRELNGGEWENLEWREILENWKEEFDRFNAEPDITSTPGGESIEDLQLRVRNKIFEIVKISPDSSVCIVSHAIAIKAFLCYVHHVPIKNMDLRVWCQNTGVTAFDVSDDGRIRILFENDTRHLNGME
ncbi:MAG: histidine phosphatase family protein [Clostridia bacterium]|nr:histidine phosphatase family protein [Clostridia bacterium]